MKKFIFCAFFALGIGVPGIAHTSPICSIVETAPSSEIDSILKAAANQSEYSYGCLCVMYNEGNVTIDKTDDGTYRVTVIDGGGIVVISILDDA